MFIAASLFSVLLLFLFLFDFPVYLVLHLVCWLLGVIIVWSSFLPIFYRIYRLRIYVVLA
jgi:hypothetical protein